MQVADVMTRDVITVPSTASITTAARRLVDHGISGMPVVDEEARVVGIISEGDLIERQRPRSRPRGWHLLLANDEQLARDYQKATGITVAEVMTRAVVAVAPDAPIETAAALLHEHRIRRLPVMADGRLVGIVSRGDLVKAVVEASVHRPRALTDAQIIREMTERMAAERWVTTRTIVVQARDGIVALAGVVESDAERGALGTMARAIPGCRGVDNQLVVSRRLPAGV